MPPILRLSTITATLCPRASWRLPPHPEIMVRGALGARLFDLCCRRPARDCRACAHRATCAVPTWWDPGRGLGQGVRPFVPVVPAGGGVRVGPRAPWSLRLVLLTAVPEPDLLLAMLERTALSGLGPNRVRHRLEHVEVAGDHHVVVWQGERTGAPWPGMGSLPRPPVDPDRLVALRVHFLTPWRWSPPRGRAFTVAPTTAPTAADLVRAAWHRVRPVQRAQGLDFKAHHWPDPTGLAGHWENHRVQRVQVRSTRQGEILDLSGHRGVMVLGAESAPWADLLATASAINIGRQSSYGLGRFELEWFAR